MKLAAVHLRWTEDQSEIRRSQVTSTLKVSADRMPFMRFTASNAHR